MINDRPCKISDMSTSKTGKHGHAKVKLVTYDIFTGKKLEAMSPSTHNMDVPNVKRIEYQVINYEDDHLTLMDDQADTFDVRINQDEASEVIKTKQKELIEKFENGDDVMATVLKACGEEMVVDWKGSMS